MFSLLPNSWENWKKSMGDKRKAKCIGRISNRLNIPYSYFYVRLVESLRTDLFCPEFGCQLAHPYLLYHHPNLACWGSSTWFWFARHSGLFAKWTRHLLLTSRILFSFFFYPKINSHASSGLAQKVPFSPIIQKKKNKKSILPKLFPQIENAFFLPVNGAERKCGKSISTLHLHDLVQVL